MEGRREKPACFIVGAGSFEGFLTPPQKGDLVIAADGGYVHLKKQGIEPDVLMGDFDSLDQVPDRELIRHPPMKDDTDMALAVAYARERGFGVFYLYGGLGGRLDHTLANLQLLTMLSRQGAHCHMIGEGNVVTAITEEKIWFPQEAKGMISVFCAGEEALGITEHGLKYSLSEARLTCERALGVSNEFTGTKSWIQVRQGTLILLWQWENGLEEGRINAE
ncbi:MAG TPA: thiamine diphosphokinase [Candidatus Choladousia intestinigallinarum]|nr:thiamine diphosphokinase [Candidatus Choladousia intestinigallinarum]